MSYNLIQTRRNGLIGEFEPPALIEKFKTRQMALNWVGKRGYKWNEAEQGYVQGSMTQYVITIEEIEENIFDIKSFGLR